MFLFPIFVNNKKHNMRQLTVYDGKEKVVPTIFGNSHEMRSKQEWREWWLNTMSQQVLYCSIVKQGLQSWWCHMFSYMIFVILLTFCWHFQLKIWHLHRMWCRWQISGKHAFFKKLWTKLYTSFLKVVFTKYFVCTFTIVPNTFLYFSMVTPSMVTLTIFKMGHMLWDHKGRTVGRWHLWVQTVHRWQICHLCL